MLTPGAKKTHRAYAFAGLDTSEFSDTAAVVYDFSRSGAGEHALNLCKAGRSSWYARFWWLFC